jgi:hypothetical protein
VGEERKRPLIEGSFYKKDSVEKAIFSTEYLKERTQLWQKH